MDISVNPVENLEITLDTGNSINVSLLPITESLDYEIDHVEELETSLETSENLDIDMTAGIIIIGKKYPEYEGPYTAVPKVRDQIFETDKKSMEDNFTVTKITHLETLNSGGGLTITIGEI